MPGHEMESAEILEDLRTRFARVERAIMGDPSVGHRGLVYRVEAIEGLAETAVDIHQSIDNRRVDGDRRLHERLDKHEEIARNEVAAIGKKIDRVIWVFIGAFAGGLGTGGGVMYAILGG